MTTDIEMLENARAHNRTKERLDKLEGATVAGKPFRDILLDLLRLAEEKDSISELLDPLRDKLDRMQKRIHHLEKMAALQSAGLTLKERLDLLIADDTTDPKGDA